MIVAESLERVDLPLETMLRDLKRGRPEEVIGQTAAALARLRDPRPFPPWLRPEQQVTCSQLLPILKHFQCALLADPVGSGKTWVALGVAATWGGGDPPVALVPAGILSQWSRAAAAAGVPITLWSHERLSRGTLPADLLRRAPGSLVIVDESHHFRNPTTLRYRHLAPALIGRSILLLTATPIVNRLHDLAAQLALGTRDDALLSLGIESIRSHLAARESSSVAVSELVIVGKGPMSGKPRRLRRKEPAPADDQELASRCERIDRLILSRSTATAALIRTVLWRALASSDLALLAVLRRYRGLLHQAQDAARSGKVLNRASLKLLVGDAADQLVMWGLFPEQETGGDLVVDDLDLLNLLIAEAKKKAGSADHKSKRLAALVGDGIPTLVFTGARETVRYLREQIPRAAWCTGTAAGIGFSSMSREDVLSWFRPGAPSRRIRGPTVLLTTDVSSEGLDLQRTARVVHYDLPWTSVRIDQRDGRALRLGSAHDAVEVIRFDLPPVIEQRLGQLGLIASKRRLPRKAGIDPNGTRLWTWREDMARRFGEPPCPGQRLYCKVESSSDGILASFTLTTAESAGERLATITGYLDSAGIWSEDPDLVCRMMETALESPARETTGDLPGDGLSRIAAVIQQRLRSASLARWAGHLSPLQSTRIARLNRIASRAVRSRNGSLLAAVERAIAYVRQGHTAGEEMLLERAFAHSDSELIRHMRSLPEAQARGWTIFPQLIGLVVFAPRRHLPAMPTDRIRTLLFDLDGTLIDSIRLILDSYHHTFKTHGLPPRTDEEWLAGIGTPLRVVFGEIAEHPEQMGQLIATYRDYNLAHHDTQVIPYVGAPELIRRVKDLGYRTGLVTSKNRPGAVRGLKLAGIADHFDVLVCADDVINPKPHPEPVLKAMAQLGAVPGETLFIGDSVHDMRCGREAGVLTGAVLWGPFGRGDLESTHPDYWLDTPEDLLTLLKAPPL